MRPRYLLSLATVLGMCAGGCGETRQEVLMRDHFPSYPQEIKDAIQGGYLVKGMDQDQVFLTLGPTPCVTARTEGGKTFASWAYKLDTATYKVVAPSRCFESQHKPYTVYFENGRVTQWDY